MGTAGDDNPTPDLIPPFFGDSDPVQYGLDGNDVLDPTLEGVYYLDGGRGNDILVGRSGPDTLVGGEGNDAIYGGLGDDFINGGAGNDSLTGGFGGDKIDGGSGNDLVAGEDGDDELSGGPGSDALNGGPGNDTMDGGLGADQFYFNSALDKTANVDAVADFSPGEDTINLAKAIFTALNTGVLPNNAFHEGGKAADGNDHIIYNERKGRLSYDADGKGGAKQILFATLDKHLDLSHSDILVF